jgi:hypothetical protein
MDGRVPSVEAEVHAHTLLETHWDNCVTSDRAPVGSDHKGGEFVAATREPLTVRFG